MTTKRAVELLKKGFKSEVKYIFGVPIEKFTKKQLLVVINHIAEERDNLREANYRIRKDRLLDFKESITTDNLNNFIRRLKLVFNK